MLISVIEIVFWVSVFMAFYAYFGYPIVLMIMAMFCNRDVKKGAIEPAVSFIITAYNEEKFIGTKIENTLSQDYPREKLEIIVASDCSDDRTDDIVRLYGGKGVCLVRAEHRGGKEAAQKHALGVASGEIIVFSDVATILDPAGVAGIVQNFADPSVGCVSSEDRFVDHDGTVSGEEAYVKYEMFLRQLETRVNTLVGLSGSFFAARRTVCRSWATDLQSDFNTLLNAVKMGLRGVSDPASIGYYRNILNETDEFNRKVRTVLRGITVLMKNLETLNPFRFGLFAWQVFSHKLCRWLVPMWIVIAFVTNLFLVSHSPFYMGLFVLQVSFFCLAAIHLVWKPRPIRKISRLAGFFVVTNTSIFRAWIDYLEGHRMVKWDPSKR